MAANENYLKIITKQRISLFHSLVEYIQEMKQTNTYLSDVIEI